MAGTRGTRRAREPRAYLVDPKEYGVVPAAEWQPVTDDTDLVDVIAAYWQHLAVCVLRDKYSTTLRQVMVERLEVDNVEHLDRQLSGAYRVRLKTLIEWTLAVGDVTVLPPQADSINDLFPPGANWSSGGDGGD